MADMKVWLSPAKLNLFLHILGQREDGYHNLQTVFQFINFCDELRFEIRSDQQIVLHDPIQHVSHDDNLIIKAAKSLQQITNTQHGIDIYLQKKIPLGSGLGGGSSNAATTLVALNAIWNLQLSKSELQKLALHLGADVPIFVHGQAAWAEGIGEQFTSIELPESWFVVIIPPLAIQTQKFFSDPELTRNTPSFTIREFLEGKETRNDFEALACRYHPEIAAAIEWLGQYDPARLTGSGSCIFAAIENEKKAQQIVQQLPAGLTGFYAKGLNQSPLFKD
jgi:4-diphosphocytidyl-2-C-methyl-D-erythritol kinase